MLQSISFYFLFQFIYLSLSELILAINEYKGIDNPLARVGCKYFVCVCRYCRPLSVWISYWFDNLGSLLREILSATILLHTSSSEKIPTQLTSSRKNFCRRCRGDIIKYLQVPSHKLSFTCSTFYLPLLVLLVSLKKSKTQKYFILLACLKLLSCLSLRKLMMLLPLVWKLLIIRLCY